MKAKLRMLRSRMLILAAALTLALFLAAYDNLTQNSRATTNSAYSASSYGIALPTPVSTMEAVPTFDPFADRFKPKPLTNSSPEEVGQVAINWSSRRWPNFTMQVLLSKSTTLDEVAGFGWGTQHFASIETPPLMVVVLKGTSDLNPRFQSKNNGTLYVGLVFDLWAGVPSMWFTSPNGEGFAKVLNDPTLPSMPSASRPSALPSPVSTAQQPIPAPPTTGPNKVPIAQVTPEGVPNNQVGAGDFGAWQYTAYIVGPGGGGNSNGVDVKPGDVTANVACKANTQTGIDGYITSNKQLLARVVKNGGQAEVLVVFSHYQSVDSFRAWVKAHGLKVTDTHLRGVDGNVYKDMPVHSPDGTTDPLPADRMNTINNYNAQNYPTLINKGVYLVRARADTKELLAIAAEPFVSFIDVIPSVIRMELVNKGVRGATQINVDSTCAGAISYVVETGLYDKSK